MLTERKKRKKYIYKNLKYQYSDVLETIVLFKDVKNYICFYFSSSFKSPA